MLIRHLLCILCYIGIIQYYCYILLFYCCTVLCVYITHCTYIYLIIVMILPLLGPWLEINTFVCLFINNDQGRIQGGRTRRAPPLKLEKIWFVGVKSWFFTRNTPKIFAPPSAIGKNMIFCRKIVIFHTKYPKIFRTSLRSARFF
jgi:hypothetical protein